MRNLLFLTLCTLVLILFTPLSQTALGQTSSSAGSSGSNDPVEYPIVLYPDNDYDGQDPAPRNGKEPPGNQNANDPTDPIFIDRVGPSVNVRPPIHIDTDTVGSAHGPAMASDRDLAALVYVDCGTNGDHSVYVSLSDGRGIDWSDPIRVDSDVTAADKETTAHSIAVVDGHIYVAWIDERFGSGKEEICFNVSHDGGETWAGETLIDKGYIAGTGAVRDWRMVVTRDPAGKENHVFFAVAVDPTSSANEELYFTASHDGGVSFRSAVHVPAETVRGAADIDAVAMDAEGLSVSIVWQDDRNRSGFNGVYFRSSHDGGQTWNSHDIALKTAPPGTSHAGGQIDVAQIGATIVAAWQENRASSINDELRANISLDGGESWLSDDKLIGNYRAGVDDVDSVDVFISKDYFPLPTPPIMVLPIPAIAWDDNRSGVDEVYLASSGDSGETWTERRISERGGSDPALSGGNGMVGITWTGGSFPSAVSSAFSTDSGLSWKGGFEVSHSGGSDAKSGRIEFNYLYNNFICGWVADDLGADNVYVGGYRPQTLVPVGEFRRGSPVHFEVYHWGEAASQFSGETHFGVLISTGLGDFSLPANGGKNTGLLFDAFLQTSLSLNPGILSGVITPFGGRTEEFIFPLTNTLPRVLTLRCVAVGFNPLTIPHGFGKITDVIDIALP